MRSHPVVGFQTSSVHSMVVIGVFLSCVVRGPLYRVSRCLSAGAERAVVQEVFEAGGGAGGELGAAAGGGGRGVWAGRRLGCRGGGRGSCRGPRSCGRGGRGGGRCRRRSCGGLR